jgi:TolA-binding protein
MALLRRWLLLWGALVCAAPLLQAATAENRAFDAAYGALRGTAYERAENEFTQFIHTYTNSPRIPEAILYQAQARFYRTNYAGALELLTTNQTQAGRLGDEYLFWRGETLLQRGDFRAAGDTFGKIGVDFPSSTNRLRAALRQAVCRSKLADWPGVLELQTNALFQSAARTNANDEEVVRGYLLLAEASLAQTNCGSAEATLKPLAQVHLAPPLDWERHHLLCRILLADGRPVEALQISTNLFPLAVAAGQPRLQAESAAFQGGIFERLGQLDEAIADYQKNLAGGIPPEAQRQALLKISELTLARNRIADAVQMLERFLKQYPDAPARDLALVTLGELRLRRSVSEPGADLFAATNSPAATNLVQAMAALQDCLTNRLSAWLGRAELYLGWCYWNQTNLPACQTNFEAAVRDLAPSPEQAMAYYKLADIEFKIAQTQTNLANPVEAQMRQTNLLQSITNYQAVVDKFKGVPAVETNLFERALYQVVRAGLAAGDLAAATNALAKILDWYPNGLYADRAVLLTGQAAGEQNPAAAREVFVQFLRISTNALLAAEVQLAIARTYEQEGKWDLAIGQYDQWLDIYTNHPARPRAEFARALANSSAGFQTNALTQLTNLVARFPNSTNVPLAQWWVADYYYLSGDSEGAEKNFQAIFQNTNTPPQLEYEAILMAGRAAFKRQGWKDARDYFNRLISRLTNAAPTLRAQAYFAYGDTLVTQASTNKLGDYGEALTAYKQVGVLCPTNPIAMLALGARANCYLQCGRPDDLNAATNAYQQVVDADPALADAAVRSGAKVGLGITLEKIAQQPEFDEKAKLNLLEAALKQYLDVYYHSDFLRGDEKADLFWTVEAGLEAGRLLTDSPLKERHAGTEALFIYQDLQKLVPSLRLETKINALKAQQQVVSQQN